MLKEGNEGQAEASNIFPDLPLHVPNTREPPKSKALRRSAILTETLVSPESTSCKAWTKSWSRSSGKVRFLMKPSTSLRGSGLRRLRLPLVVGSSRLASSVWVQFSTSLSSSVSRTSSIVAAGAVGGSGPGSRMTTTREGSLLEETFSGKEGCADGCRHPGAEHHGRP